MMQQKLIAFIGGGNMAQAIVLGLLKQGYPADKIIVNDPNEEKRTFFAQYGVAVSTDNEQSITQSQVVLFAVKPQVLADVCKPLSAVDFSDKLIISIAAGISTARLAELIPTAKSIVRVMPNTPALVGEGMAGLFADKNTFNAAAVVPPFEVTFSRKVERAVCGFSITSFAEPNMACCTNSRDCFSSNPISIRPFCMASKIGRSKQGYCLMQR
jgi:hypothetical protein